MTPGAARLLGLLFGLSGGGVSFAEQPVVESWHTTHDTLACGLATTLAQAGDHVEIRFDWARDSGTAFGVVKGTLGIPISDYEIETGPGSVALSGERAPALLRIVEQNASWVVVRHRDGAEPLRFDVPEDGSVAAAMFTACIDANLNWKPLSDEKQRAIVYGPMLAPKGMDAHMIPGGCRLAGGFQTNPPLEFQFDVTDAGSAFVIQRGLTFSTKESPALVLDLGALGGPKTPMNDKNGIRFVLSAQAADALRADVMAGEARVIAVLEKDHVIEQLGFGMLVNEPIVRMFDACLGARQRS